MENAEVFVVLSRCFAPVDQHEWNDLVSPEHWEVFLTSARSLLQRQEALSCDVAPLSRIGRPVPFEEFLVQDEVRALYAPPSASELSSFAARHFTGGLPSSAVPVESLYVAWSNRSQGSLLGNLQGHYCSDAAVRMRDLMATYGLDEKSMIAPYPDHLAVELDFAAFLLKTGNGEDAREFISERFSWLSSYRARMVKLGDEALFHLAIIDLVLGIRAQQCEENGRSEE